MSREDHSVLDGKPAERRRHSLADPLEDLSQLVEEGQGAGRRCRERPVSAHPTPPMPTQPRLPQNSPTLGMTRPVPLLPSQQERISLSPEYNLWVVFSLCGREKT